MLVVDLRLWRGPGLFLGHMAMRLAVLPPATVTLGFDIHWHILRNTMREACGYGKHKAVLKEYLSPETKAARNKWAHDIYVKYPHLWDWHRVRFTDEFHAGYGPEG